MTQKSKPIALAVLVFALGGVLGILGLDWWGSDETSPSQSSGLTLGDESQEPASESLPFTPRGETREKTRGEGNGEFVPAFVRKYPSIDLEVVVKPPADATLRAPVRVRIAEAPPLHRQPRVRKREAMAPAEDPVLTFTSIPPGRYDVFVWSEGFDMVWMQPELPDTDPSPTLHVSLLPLASLSGRLHVEEKGAALPPPANVPVHLHRTEVTIEGYKPRFETRTDSIGSYSFARVPRGSYELYVGPVQNPLVPPLRVQVSQPGDVQDVHKVPRSGEAILQVVDGEGAPVEGVRLTVTPREDETLVVDDETGDPVTARGGGQGDTDEQGIFRLGGLPIGSYTVVGRKDGFRSLLTRFEIPADTAPIPVALVLRR